MIYDTLGPWLKSIFFFDTLKGFAVGDNGVILSTTNGGNTWTSIVAPVQRDFNAITFLNADTGYIVGGTPSGLCRRTILRTINGGANWTVLIDNVGGILKDISFADTMEGYAVGDSATVLKTTDGGLNWLTVVIDTNLIGNESFNAVKFSNRNFGVIGGKAGVLYVYQDGPMELNTLGILTLGSVDATLQGGINTHFRDAKYSFVYSDNISFSTSLSTPEVNVQNNLLLLVSQYIQGLTPNTKYYYFLKATSAQDTIYGDTLNFYTGVNPPYSFLTLDATEVSTGGATMNGFINKFPEPVNLFFEYGTSPAFGSEIAATPNSVNDTLMHDIQARLTPLEVHKQYFFRLKGVTGTRTYYGDTKMFIVENMPAVSTGNATTISLNTARLNGIVNANNLSVVIKFEYGMTSYYGTEVNGVPDSITGMSDIHVTYLLSGLSLMTIYHFRIKAISSLGASYGRDMTFMISGASAITLPASSIGESSAQLNGIVNAKNFPTANKFEYGTTTSYGNEVTTTPDTANGNSDVNISYQLSGLSLNTIYHYRVKAINPIGISYGNDISFTTISHPTVLALPATDITFNSAKLNAIVNPHHVTTTLKFDYGLTSSYDSEIVCNPSSSSDSVEINVYANLNGLISNATYHFSIKAITQNDTVLSNDLIFFTGHSEIPNYDFEIWDSTSIDFPDNWTQAMGMISKYSPACSGDYAIRIQNTPDAFMGLVTLGLLENGFRGTGVPFNARPDTLVGCFNYNIDFTDTSWVGLLLTKNGNPISQNIFGIAGNSGGNFVEKKFPIKYESSEIPDSLILIISSSNFNQNIHSPNSWIIVDNIRFTGTSLNIPNNNFEQWHTEKGLDLTGWYYQNRGMIPIDTTGTKPVIRTTDAASNKYAVEVKTFFEKGSPISGSLWNGSEKIGKFPVYMRHQSLTGFYKFFPQNGDTMLVSISMYKNGLQIGLGNFLQKNTITSYAPFIVDISYYSPDIPDSASITIQSYNWYPPLGNSVLYVDNLNFDGFFTGIKEIPSPYPENFEFNIHPNPFNDQAIITFNINQDEPVMVRLFDISGKHVALLANEYYKKGEHTINIFASNLGKGFYICVINTGNQALSRKLIIY